jgi:single-strand DNA-binding protein
MNDITVTVVGNVTGAVQMRFTADGTPVASFRMAHNSRYFNRSANTWMDRGSSYFTVSCWRGMSRNVAASLTVGMPVVVVGRLRQREVERQKDGVTFRTLYNDIEALALGPDLSRGVATFERVKGRAVVEHEERSVADAMAAAGLEAEEGTTPGPLSAGVVASPRAAADDGPEGLAAGGSPQRPAA